VPGSPAQPWFTSSASALVIVGQTRSMSLLEDRLNPRISGELTIVQSPKWPFSSNERVGSSPRKLPTCIISGSNYGGRTRVSISRQQKRQQQMQRHMQRAARTYRPSSRGETSERPNRCATRCRMPRRCSCRRPRGCRRRCGTEWSRKERQQEQEQQEQQHQQHQLHQYVPGSWGRRTRQRPCRSWRRRCDRPRSAPGGRSG